MDDTICAISTAVGIGGISIIRVSGKEALSIVNGIFKGKDLRSVQSHTINYGHIVFEDKIIDEVLVSVMLSPKTYTTEDVVEINLHGGIATTNKVLEILLNSGCRLAEPGEFTKRAFLNGRIDLVEAEAVEEVIKADNDNARSLSVNQLTGKISDIIRKMKERLIGLETNIEVNIDYPEYEDIEDMTNSKVLSELEDFRLSVDDMIKESNTGRIIKDGIDVAIIGKPNVGKSSVLNALLEEEKAIVTDIEGTTRDIVEGTMMLDGVKLNFIDTAGIRKTDDVVEKIGVDKAKEQINKADVVILVLNNNEPLSEEEKELLDLLKNKKHIIFINKDDLVKKMDVEFEGAVYGNTMSNGGLDKLKKRISEMFSLEEIPKKDFTYISNARQLSLMKKVREAIDKAITSLKEGMPVDVVSIDLEEARTHLGELLGEVYDEELIDELFQRFCLGK